VTVPVIDVTRAMLKGDGLQLAAVNCPCTFCTAKDRLSAIEMLHDIALNSIFTFTFTLQCCPSH